MRISQLPYRYKYFMFYYLAIGTLTSLASPKLALMTLSTATVDKGNTKHVTITHTYINLPILPSKPTIAVILQAEYNSESLSVTGNANVCTLIRRSPRVNKM